MTKVNFKFWVNDNSYNDLVIWLKELTAKEKMTSTIIEILEFVRKNGLEHLKNLEALKREKLVAEIAEIKSRTAHRDTKDKPITPPLINQKMKQIKHLMSLQKKKNLMTL